MKARLDRLERETNELYLRRAFQRISREEGLDPEALLAEANRILLEIEAKYGGDFEAWKRDHAAELQLS